MPAVTRRFALTAAASALLAPRAWAADEWTAARL